MAEQMMGSMERREDISIIIQRLNTQATGILHAVEKSTHLLKDSLPSAMGLLGLSYGMNHKSESYGIMTASVPDHMLELWTAFEEEVVTAQKRMQKLIDDLKGVPEHMHGEREEDFIKQVYKDVLQSHTALFRKMALGFEAQAAEIHASHHHHWENGQEDKKGKKDKSKDDKVRKKKEKEEKNRKEKEEKERKKKERAERRKSKKISDPISTVSSTSGGTDISSSGSLNTRQVSPPQSSPTAAAGNNSTSVPQVPPTRTHFTLRGTALPLAPPPLLVPPSLSPLPTPETQPTEVKPVDATPTGTKEQLYLPVPPAPSLVSIESFSSLPPVPPESPAVDHRKAIALPTSPPPPVPPRDDQMSDLSQETLLLDLEDRPLPPPPPSPLPLHPPPAPPSGAQERSAESEMEQESIPSTSATSSSSMIENAQPNHAVPLETSSRPPTLAPPPIFRRPQPTLPPPPPSLFLDNRTDQPTPSAPNPLPPVTHDSTVTLRGRGTSSVGPVPTLRPPPPLVPPPAMQPGNSTVISGSPPSSTSAMSQGEGSNTQAPESLPIHKPVDLEKEKLLQAAAGMVQLEEREKKQKKTKHKDHQDEDRLSFKNRLSFWKKRESQSSFSN